MDWPISVHTAVARVTTAADLISRYVYCSETITSYGKNGGNETLFECEYACTNAALVYLKLRSDGRREQTTLGVAERTATLTGARFIAPNVITPGCTKTFTSRVPLCLCTDYILRHAKCCTAQYTYLLTYLLILWCRVLPEKLTGLQLVKKFPAFHGTRRLITALTSVRQLSILGQPNPVYSLT